MTKNILTNKELAAIESLRDECQKHIESLEKLLEKERDRHLSACRTIAEIRAAIKYNGGVMK